ncbi:RNA polymerase sigma factor [Sorangium sp. So ce406]|uniref:RNA polymerase sigma factor n=1 Tax=Sorangium sp. So ce406 TaxID=3133311 RepID=UPI003F5C88C8
MDALAQRARGGDPDALDQLVRALQDPMYRLALRFLGRPEPARDATQEILLLIVMELPTFRGESSVRTWAYRVATRLLLRLRRRGRRWTFEALADEDLGQPPNAIEADTRALADERLLEEEVFIGCTQAMLQALDRPQRIALVLGAICELEAAEASYVLGISEVAFRKRLSRARATLDAFLARHCGVADPTNPCRCAYQVNLNVARRCVNPARLNYAVAPTRTTLEVLRAEGEIRQIRLSLDLFRTQPKFSSTEDFAERVRALVASASSLSGAQEASGRFPVTRGSDAVPDRSERSRRAPEDP